MVLTQPARVNAFELTGHHQPAELRVRVLFNHAFVADTKGAELVWEHRHYPFYYIPLRDVKKEYLLPSASGDGGENERIKGVDFLAKPLRLRVGEKETEKVHQVVEGDLKDYVRLDFGSMDAWYEEDAEMVSHPKDPYKRLDIFPSSRHVLVKVDGVTVAESSKVLVLVETLTPVRYYLPKSTLKWEFLEESDKETKCPYKGTANYYSVIVNGKKHEDAVWWYKFPVTESFALAGHASFYNEKADIYVDGVLQEKPVSRFTTGKSAYTA